MAEISYRRHRFPPVIIQQAVWGSSPASASSKTSLLRVCFSKGFERAQSQLSGDMGQPRPVTEKCLQVSPHKVGLRLHHRCEISSAKKRVSGLRTVVQQLLGVACP